MRVRDIRVGKRYRVRMGKGTVLGRVISLSRHRTMDRRNRGHWWTGFDIRVVYDEHDFGERTTGSAYGIRAEMFVREEEPA